LRGDDRLKLRVQLFTAGAIFDIDVTPGNDYANALPLEQTLVL
jgi:hypothetical protein